MPPELAVAVTTGSGRANDQSDAAGFALMSFSLTLRDGHTLYPAVLTASPIPYLILLRTLPVGHSYLETGGNEVKIIVLQYVAEVRPRLRPDSWENKSVTIDEPSHGIF